MSAASVHTRILVIRHGQSVDNVEGRISGWTDSALTDLGHRQARRMADHVSSRYQPTVIYASSLQRARHTAAPLVERTGAPLVIRPGLRELHFGVAEGLTPSEISERYGAVWAEAQKDVDQNFGWPGGETRVEFFKRIQAAFDDIVANHAGETVAVVSHGGVIGSFLAHLFEGNPAAWRRYQLHNCSVTQMVGSRTEIEVLQWNQVEHLVDEN